MLIELCDVDAVAMSSMLRIDVPMDENVHSYCVINIAGDFYVIDDTCTHADFSLAEGFLDEEKKEVECFKHSATFNLESGEPTCLPATQPVKTYVAQIQDGKVYIEVQDNV